MLEVVAEWGRLKGDLAPHDDSTDSNVTQMGMQIPLFEELYSAAAR